MSDNNEEIIGIVIHAPAPEEIARVIVANGVYREVFQEVCNICNVKIEFAENGTLIMSNLDNPLLTRDMAHQLREKITDDQWHRYSVMVKRAEQGVLIGDETFAAERVQ